MENINHYCVLLKSGKGSYSKDILDLKFSEDMDIRTLFDMIIKDHARIQELEKEFNAKLEEYQKATTTALSLLADASDMESRQISEIITQLDEVKNKLKFY